jgi:transposase
MSPPLTTKEKIQILLHHGRGRSMRSIAKQFNCSVGTVAGTVKKFNTLGSVERKKYSRSSTFSSPPIRRKLRDFIRRHRQWPTKRILSVLRERYHINTSRFTLGRERRRMSFRRVLRKKRPTLTLKHRYKRMRYAIENEEEEWNDVWFSDEKQFRVDLSRGKVWKQPWEDPIINYIPPRTIAVLVWGAISFDGRTTLHTSAQPFDTDAYINIIDKHLIQQQPDSYHRLLQDNASQHKSNLTLDYLNNFDIELVQNYPPCSPELNPIEHVWSWMVNYINQESPSNLSSLKQRVKDAWIAIPQNTIQRYISHLPTVCEQIIEAEGGNILG